MARDEIVVGLEIGTSKVCVIVGEIKSDRSIKIIGVGEAASRGVRKGEIVDFDICGKCIREAIVEAEEKSDVLIKNIYLGVTGAHMESFSNRGKFDLPDDRDEISNEDVEAVQEKAREITVANQHTFLHTILQHYYVDDQAGVLNPVGMFGKKLEADFHIIHGVASRIKNTIRCVKELDLEVEDIVFNPYAAAQVVLDQQHKNVGALMIDMGGGTTGYMVYLNGAVEYSGVLGLGGDHITNDLSLGLRVPMAKAEKLKIEHGCVTLGNTDPGDVISLRDEHGFAGKDIERETLNTIIHLRVRETLEQVKKRLIEDNVMDLLGAGIVLTGGSSMLRGVKHLAEEVFGVPVQMTRAQNMTGNVSAFENPKYSTAIGLVKYAQATFELDNKGLFGSIFNWLVSGRK
jgi:cell division protein FtsA